MPEDKEPDVEINAALATYAEPKADMELAGRILDRMAAEPARPPRLRRLGWAVALPAAICVLLLVRSGPKTAKPDVAAPEQTARLGNRAAQLGDRARFPARPRTAVVAREQTGRRIHRPQPHPSLLTVDGLRALPKLDVFPTPEPPTPQERALAVYVAHLPPAEQRALARSEQEPVPLTVASIHTLPLATPGVRLLGPPSKGEY